MIANWLLWSVALHIIGFAAWLAALWYLPRLFIYHHGTAPGSEASEIFKVMERRLLKAIATPAMIWTIAFGLIAATVGYQWSSGWLHAKLVLVLLLAAIHGLLAADLKRFARDERPRTVFAYRVINEMPTVLFIVIVFLAVFKPI